MHQPTATVFVTPVALLAVLLLAGCSTQKHLKRGHAAWDRGDAVSAEHHFEAALKKRDALTDDPAFLESLRVARRDAALQRGGDAMQRQQWETAVELFETSLHHEPGYAPALQRRHEAGAHAADDLYAAAVKRADYNDLPAARTLLEKSLRMRPGFPEAEAALASLDTAGRGTGGRPGDTAGDTSHGAPAGYAAALEAVQQQRWAEAEPALRSVIAAAPGFLPARAALHRMRGAASDDLIAHAKSALQRQDPAQAEASFTEALHYRPDNTRVRRGLADADLLRSALLAEADRPGAALLAARAAFAHVREDRKAQALIDRYTEKLRADHAVSLRLTADDAAAPHADAARAVAASLAARLRCDFDDVLRITATPAASDNAAQADAEPDARVTFHITEADVTSPVPHDEIRQHCYEVVYEVPNPRLRHLRDKLDRSLNRIQDLACDEQRVRRRLADARRNGDTDQTSHLERRINRVRRDLRDERKCRDDLSHELNRAPDTIEEVRQQQWPYTVQLHKQLGTLRGSWSLDGQPAVPFSAEFRESDEVILDANPSIGLPEDPLELTAEAQVIDTMTSAAAGRIVGPIARAALAARIAELESLADAAGRAGEPQQSLERRVAAAVLVSATDPDVGIARLDALSLLPTDSCPNPTPTPADTAPFTTSP